MYIVWLNNRPILYIYINIYHHTDSASCSSASGVCAPVGGRKKIHQLKLQWVSPPPVQGVFLPMAEGKTPQAQVAASDHHHV